MMTKRITDSSQATNVRMNSYNAMLCLLLLKVEEFDKRMAEEHVEDYLMYKRVAELDDEAYIYRYGTDITRRPAPHASKIMLTKIEGFNRQRRNFRLMRDWIGGRPW